MNFKKPGIIHICTLGILIKFFFLIIYQPWDPKVNEKQVLVNDAKEYHGMAVNLVENQHFNSTLRTPLYPFFISFVYFLFGARPYIVLIIQIFLDAVTCFFIYKIVVQKFSVKAGCCAALFYVMDPFIVVYSLTMYSDIFFTLFIVVSIHFLLLFENSRKTKSLIFSAFFLGLSILIRPVAFLLPILIPLYILFYERKFFSKWALLFVSITFFTISPWLIRNLVEFNKWSLSTSGEYNLLILYTAPVVANQYKISTDAAEKAVLAEANQKIIMDGLNPDSLNDFQKSKYWNLVSRRYIKKYPQIFFKLYCVGIFHSFWNLDTRDISEMLHLRNKGTYFNMKGRTDFINITKEFFLRKSKEEIVLAFFLFAYLLVSYFFCYRGMVFLYKNPADKIHLLLTICILYFIFVSGTAGLVRFRVPSIPFTSIFAGIGIYYFYQKMSKSSKAGRKINSKNNFLML